jgi:hypothetical protein
VRVLDQAFELYRANFKTVVLGTAIVLFPMALLMSLAQVFYYRGLLELFAETIVQGAQGGVDPFTSPDEMLGLSMSSVAVQAVGPLYWAARAYIATCVFSAGPRMLAGERLELREFLTPGLIRVIWVAVAWLLVGLMAQVGLLLLIVPGIIVWVSLSVAAPASVIEELSAPAAITRSWRLTQRSWWRIIGFWMLLATLVLFLEAAVHSPTVIRQLVLSVSDPMAVFQPTSTLWKTFEGVLTALATSIAYPFGVFAWFCLYIDLRARREGMDIVARAMDMEVGK